MSDLVLFEDLGALDGPDLRAVFDQVPESQMLDALAGAPASLRQQLLARFPEASSRRLAERLAAHETTSVEAVRTAQRAVVDALCRLSRAGQVAFDDPDDMVA